LRAATMCWSARMQWICLRSNWSARTRIAEARRGRREKPDADATGGRGRSGWCSQTWGSVSRPSRRRVLPAAAANDAIHAHLVSTSDSLPSHFLGPL
jgi:hypothetical protein